MLIVDPAAFTAWESLTLKATDHLVGCPKFLVAEAVKRTARKFFRDSGVWRSKEALLITTVASQQSYAHTPITNAELARVFSAWNSEDEVEVGLPGEWSDAPDEATESDTLLLKVEARGDNVLWLAPMPTTAGALIRGTVVYIPTTAGAGLPSHAFNEWGDAIAAGAAAELVVQPKRDWSNPTLGAFLMAQFNAAALMASNQAGPVRRKPLRVTVW